MDQQIRFWPLTRKEENGNWGVEKALLHVSMIRAGGELPPDSPVPEEVQPPLGFSAQEKEPTKREQNSCRQPTLLPKGTDKMT